MTEPTENPVLTDSAALLVGYGFDLGTFEVDDLILYWSSHYPLHWLRAAILEALHQGRYKAISVGQILVIWRRRGQPLPHYSYEFERAVCDRFPPSRIGSIPAAAAATSTASDGLGAEKPQATGFNSDRSSSDNPSHTTTDDSGSLLASQTLDKNGAEENGAEEAVVSLQSLDPAQDVVIDSNLGGEPNDISANISEGMPKIPTADGEAIAPLSDFEALQSDLDKPLSDNAGSLIPSNLDSNDTSSSLLELALPRLDRASNTTPNDITQPEDFSPQWSRAAGSPTHTEAPELWGRATIMHLPIHQYVPSIPRSETSMFYAKLRAVAYSDEMP